MTGATVLTAALGSALAAATSSVLQHRSARAAPDASASGVRLLGHLLTRPAWLAGVCCAGLGLLLQIVALSGGRLALVQPLLVSGLLFALPVSILLERRRPGAHEWLWAVVVVAGLAAFLLVARPTGGHAPVPGGRLIAATAGCLTVVGSLVAAAQVAGSAARPALLGAAGGIAFGVTSALIKQSAALALSGVPQMLTAWAPYGTVVIGVLAILLAQLAYHAGPLARSLPAMTIGDPASAVAVGALGFHEQVTSTPPAVGGQIAAVLVMTIGAWQVARHSAAPPTSVNTHQPSTRQPRSSIPAAPAAGTSSTSTPNSSPTSRDTSPAATTPTGSRRSTPPGQGYGDQQGY